MKKAAEPMSDAHFEILESKNASLPDLVAADMTTQAMHISNTVHSNRDVGRHHLERPTREDCVLWLLYLI